MVVTKKLAKTRKNQLANIKKKLKLRNGYFAEYDEGKDTITVGNNAMVIVFDKEYLDKKDYMSSVSCGYGRFMEALEIYLLRTPPAGHA